MRKSRQLAHTGAAPTTDDPAAWRAGFAKLNAYTAPCPGFRGDEWRTIHKLAVAFLVERANKGAALAWTGLDLFAVHEVVGVANVNAVGALMLIKAAAGEITERAIRFGGTSYCRVAMPGAVLVWAFGG